MRRSPKIKAVIVAFMWAKELAWTFDFLQKLLNMFTPSLTQAPVRSLEKRRHVQQYIRFFNSPPVRQLYFSYFATLNRRFACLFVSINCSNLGLSLPQQRLLFSHQKFFEWRSIPLNYPQRLLRLIVVAIRGVASLARSGGKAENQGGKVLTVNYCSILRVT